MLPTFWTTCGTHGLMGPCLHSFLFKHTVLNNTSSSLVDFYSVSLHEDTRRFGCLVVFRNAKATLWLGASFFVSFQRSSSIIFLQYYFHNGHLNRWSALNPKIKIARLTWYIISQCMPAIFTGPNVRLKRAVHDCHLDLVAHMRYLSFSQVGTCNAKDI